MRRAPTATPRRDAAAPHDALRLWLRLLNCTALVERQVRSKLRAEFGTTLPRFDVLAQLDAAERGGARGLTMGELSRRLMVTNGNLTGLIERLVQERLVSRAALVTDKRTQIVRLTAAGRRVLMSMTPAHEEWIESMFSAVGHDERLTLFALLGTLRDSVRAGVQQDGVS